MTWGRLFWFCSRRSYPRHCRQGSWRGIWSRRQGDDDQANDHTADEEKAHEPKGSLASGPFPALAFTHSGLPPEYEWY